MSPLIWLAAASLLPVFSGNGKKKFCHCKPTCGKFLSKRTRRNRKEVNEPEPKKNTKRKAELAASQPLIRPGAIPQEALHEPPLSMTWCRKPKKAPNPVPVTSRLRRLVVHIRDKGFDFKLRSSPASPIVALPHTCLCCFRPQISIRNTASTTLKLLQGTDRTPAGGQRKRALPEIISNPILLMALSCRSSGYKFMLASGEVVQNWPWETQHLGCTARTVSNPHSDTMASYFTFDFPGASEFDLAWETNWFRESERTCPTDSAFKCTPGATRMRRRDGELKRQVATVCWKDAVCALALFCAPCAAPHASPFRLTEEG
ncbi:hypothetical protein B0H11DRAFT_1934424 [Mycena galericulata]|nr:hypothetical protein B0H11DRAFT_1934424 [Mycena galericulata]